MRQVVLIIPGLVAQPGEESVLGRKLEGLARLGEIGEVSRLDAGPEVPCPEALWLGMRPDQAQMAPGPLVVSALEADPPPRSTHFCLNLMSCQDGQIDKVHGTIEPAELRMILELAKKLDTKFLTLVPGPQTEHGLVWEKRGDMFTLPAPEAEGRPLAASLPEGDAERELRRYIDDSMNLLTELEFNQRRIDRGASALNLLWPWGQGERISLPNLALERGQPARVVSNSLRMAGLARLVGYRHADRGIFGRGLDQPWTKILEIVRSSSSTILLLGAFSQLRAEGVEKLEEMEWLVSRLDEALIRPLLEDLRQEPTRVLLASPGGEQGLAVVAETGKPSVSLTPYDERALDDRGVMRTSVQDSVAWAMTL